MEVEINFSICIQYWHQQIYTCVLECTNLVYMCAFVGAIIVYIQLIRTTNMMQHVTFVFIMLCGSTLHVSGALCTHHQECI